MGAHHALFGDIVWERANIHFIMPISNVRAL